jgi:hypothetical protein
LHLTKFLNLWFDILFATTSRDPVSGGIHLKISGTLRSDWGRQLRLHVKWLPNWPCRNNRQPTENDTRTS